MRAARLISVKTYGFPTGLAVVVWALGRAVGLDKGVDVSLCCPACAGAGKRRLAALPYLPPPVFLVFFGMFLLPNHVVNTSLMGLWRRKN